MTIKPILFSGPMVRALLAGEKTQTRRVLTRLKGYGTISEFCSPVWTRFNWEFRDCKKQLCVLNDGRLRDVLPLAEGDLLWVRETVACGACAPSKPSHWSPDFWRRAQGSPENVNGLWYRADDLAPVHPITKRAKWTPSIFMPRWASRLTLKVTDVRVQRLQDIDHKDAKAEGAKTVAVIDENDVCTDCHVEGFGRLWDSLNKTRGYGWTKNPYVIAATFTVHLGNVDALSKELGRAA